MPSTKQLVFDRTKFDKYQKGDLGIADKIHQEDIQPIANTCKTPQDKAMFEELMKPNKQNGLWAVEKSFFSTSLDVQKPFIELTKHTLELFGHLEYIIACISGGPNPFNLNGSYAQAFNQNIADMKQYKTGFEPESLGSSGQIDLPPPVLPENIYLGRFNSLGDIIGTDNNEQGKFYLQTDQLIWPQYQSYSDFTNEQTEVIIQDTEGVEEPYRQQILDARPESFPDEWDDMESKNQLKENYEYLPSKLKKYYIPKNTQYLNTNVDIDLEEDYDIKVKVDQDDNQLPIYTITAVLKASVRENNLAAGSGAAGNSSPQLPDPIPSQSYSRAVKFFFKKTLKVILKKYIPVLIKAKQLFATEKYVGDTLLSYMYKNFEMFDPELINKPASDPLKSKYYINDQFTLDGIANLKADRWDVNLEISNAILKISKGPQLSSNPEQSSTKLLLNLVGFTNNFMIEILDVFSLFLSGIFKVKDIPTILPGFLSYQSFRDILLQPNIYKMLGCQGLDLMTMPAFIKPPEGVQNGSETEKSFKKIVVQFINTFMEIPNTIMNQKLAAPLTIPT